MHIPRNTKRGFTLIEMIVAVSIFTVVVFVSVGALLAIADANRKANSIRTTMDNLNFAMESMARSVRTGSNYVCGSGNCPSGGTILAFTDQDGVSVTYAYDAENGRITVQKGSDTAASITSNEVDVENMKFYVTGVGTDEKQPRVTIVIEGTAGISEKTRTTFSIQTTVSQRRVES